MGRRTLVVLLVIFVVLGVIAALQGQQMGGMTVTPAVTLFRVYPDMAVLDIQAIRLHDPNNGETFTISRDDDGNWTAPGLEGTLDTEAATDIARTVVLLPYQRTLPLTTDTELETYGFRPNGRLFIEVLLINGDSHAVAIGGLTPAGTNYYALADDRDEIYLLERGPVDFLINHLETPPVA